MRRFDDLKGGFEKILSDKWWLAKVLLGGFLLINPFLLALAPTYFAGFADPESSVGWVNVVFPLILLFNVLSFWFPLGFTYEVLRRARTGKGEQLPDWSLAVLPRFAYEGYVKLVISIFTLILPVLVYLGICYVIFMLILGLPVAMLSLFLPPIMLFVIPFCGIGCLRWLDGASIWSCAVNYPENFRLMRKALPDYLLASLFLTGLNAVTTGFFYTIPFAAVFGLCLVDTWFGPIYSESVKDEPSEEERAKQREEERAKLAAEAEAAKAKKEAEKKTTESEKPADAQPKADEPQQESAEPEAKKPAGEADQKAQSDESDAKPESESSPETGSDDEKPKAS